MTMGGILHDKKIPTGVLKSILLCFVAACAPTQDNEQLATETSFQHQVLGPTPWGELAIDAAPDKFTFAIISDLSGGERDGVFSVAAEQIALLRPEFVVSIGDLIDGGTTNKDDFESEFDWFDKRAASMGVPLVRVGGNHDLTHPEVRRHWAERYGPRYSHFVYKNVLFLFMDSEDYAEDRMLEIFDARLAAIKLHEDGNHDAALSSEYYRMRERTTGKIGTDQAVYFEQVIADNPGVRWTFVFMHKPAWMNDGWDAYANVESALTERPYTVINGHFHELQYHTRAGRDHIILGTTGGSQNPGSASSFDHVSLITIGGKGGDTPSITHLRLDGILDKTGSIPAGGGALCFEAAKCNSQKAP